jgi:hypothetical protein
MELKHDWRTLNELLFPPENTSISSSTVVVLEEQGRPICGAVSSGAPFQIPNGSDSKPSDSEPMDLARPETLEKIAKAHGVDKALLLSRKQLDEALFEAAQLGSNYFQQLQSIRDSVLKRRSRRPDGEALIMSGRHFVLDLMNNPWVRRALPTRFNLLVFVDQRTSPSQPGIHFFPSGLFSYKAILLSYFQGRLDQFFEPDFSSLHENRLLEWPKETDAIGQYLESRYMIPCFGIFLYQDVWQKCLDGGGQAGGVPPWSAFVKAMDERKSFVYPMTSPIKALVAFQRIIMYLGRA